MVNRQWRGAGLASGHQRTLVFEVPRGATFGQVAGRAGWLAAAGFGFFFGYVWAVCRWGEAAGMGDGLGMSVETLLSTSAAGGVIATFVYVALLALLFFPGNRASGTSDGAGTAGAAVPVLFVASCLVGIGGIRSILWVLG